MSARRSSSKPAAAGSGKASKPNKPQARKGRLKVPKWDEKTGIANLDPGEKAFIAEECAERIEQGWSQEELAERANVSRSCVRHLEERRSGPSLRVALRIAQAFGKMLDPFIQAGRSRI
jgi:putative transcriptional regulator